MGLRREEVAYLSGVSVTWYTWLEQGRDITPSRQVLDALARTLRLSTPEHTYILSLAGYAAPRSAGEHGTEAAPGHVRRLLDALADFPAYAIAPTWGICAWNPVYAALYPTVETVPAADRNLLWLLFTDPYLRDLLPDWERTSRSYVAAFRADVGPRLGDPPFSHLINRLLDASDAFRAAWESHDIDALTSRERRFHHPVAGDLYLEQHIVTVSADPNLHLVIYVPVPTTATAARLRRLMDG